MYVWWCLHIPFAAYQYKGHYLIAPNLLLVSLWQNGSPTNVFLFYYGDEPASFIWRVNKLVFIYRIFCLFNTLIYDLLMVILPQQYPLEQWHKKNIFLFLSASFCLCYASLIYILEHRYRGELDGITVLFFFFPLVAICTISSFMRQIRIEKERLYNLLPLRRS